MSHLIPNIRRHFLSILAKCQNIGHIATFINIFATENMSDSSSAASERFGRCSLAGDEHIGRPAPLTADEGVGRCSLATDKEVGRPVLAEDEHVDALGRRTTSAAPRRSRRRRTSAWQPPPCSSSQLSAPSLSQSLKDSKLASF